MVAYRAFFSLRNLCWTALAILLFLNLVLSWYEQPVNALSELGTRSVEVFVLFYSVLHFIKRYHLSISLRSLVLIDEVRHALDAYYRFKHF